MAKKVLRFKRVYRGYDIDAVDNYIAEEKSRSDSVQLEQRERISALSSKCDSLTREIEQLKDREEQIKSAFIAATDNARRLSDDVRMRYTQELNRLKLFRAKWSAAYEQLKERYHFDKDALNMESVAVSTQLELTRYLTQDFSLGKGEDDSEMENYFKSEVERLTTPLDAVRPEVQSSPAVGELKKKIADAKKRGDDNASYSLKSDKKAGGEVAAYAIPDPDRSGFSLDEALHPTESLADICRALGVRAL